jgi:hypothetical protein
VDKGIYGAGPKLVIKKIILRFDWALPSHQIRLALKMELDLYYWGHMTLDLA